MVALVSCLISATVFITVSVLQPSFPDEITVFTPVLLPMIQSTHGLNHSRRISSTIPHHCLHYTDKSTCCITDAIRLGVLLLVPSKSLPPDPNFDYQRIQCAFLGRPIQELLESDMEIDAELLVGKCVVMNEGASLAFPYVPRCSLMSWKHRCDISTS